MDQLLNVDWDAIFSPQHSLLELFLRGTIMYLVIFVLLRVVVRRQVGGIGMTDILVIVLVRRGGRQRHLRQISSRSSRAPCWSATVLFWSYAHRMAAVALPAFERLVRDPKLKLIENGRMLRRNMREEFVTVEELMAQLREQGLEDCSDVKAAYMEADGHISIIRR